MKKTAQAWGFDLMVAMTIFLAGILIFFLYTINLTNQTEEILDTLLYDGNAIVNSLLSEGFPINWDTSNVQKIGLLSNKKINVTKLENFNTLAETDYLRTKAIFNTRFNYYMEFQENITLSLGEIEGIGLKPLNETNVVQIKRVTIYKDKPATLSLQVWE